MKKYMKRRVQREADLQGGIILDAWGEERQVDRKLTETKSYAFTFLVQSFLPNTRNTGVPGRTTPPAAGSAGGGQMAQGESEGADIKEVDMILLEIGAMLSRWSLYCRFMARKFQVYFPCTWPHGYIERMEFTFSHRNRKSHQPQLQTTTIIVGDPAATLAQSMANVVDDLSITFMVLVNNLDIAAEYCNCIVNSYITAATSFSPPEQAYGGVEPHQQAGYGDDYAPPTPLDLLFPFPNEKPEVIAALNTLESVYAETNRGRFRCEVFWDVDYSTTTTITTTATLSTSANTLSASPPPLSSSSSNLDADDDLVKSHFELGFTSLIKPVNYILTDMPFTKLLTYTATYLSRLLEKKIIQLGGGISSSNYPSNAYPPSSDPRGQISELGAVRLEKDVLPGIINVVVKAGRFGVREAFARCVQICLVLGGMRRKWGGCTVPVRAPAMSGETYSSVIDA
ncbi:COG4 transport protein-domain-containing protein [Terfezia claveryi]|nr:COG4 transport protein-domain-containing protein [Terfezia claveryi]